MGYSSMYDLKSSLVNLTADLYTHHISNLFYCRKGFHSLREGIPHGQEIPESTVAGHMNEVNLATLPCQVAPHLVGGKGGGQKKTSLRGDVATDAAF